MANRFNTPIQGTPTQNYVSQHVDMPLDLLEASLQQSQNQYDSTESLGMSKKSELAGIQGVGNWANQTLAGKKKELSDFTSSYDGKDLGSREVASAFKQKINDLSEDTDIAKIQNFNTRYKQYQANIEKMKESGDFATENAWQNTKAMAQYSENGNDSGFDPVIEKGVNIGDEAAKYFKSLHGSSQEAMRSIADGQGGSIYYDNKSGGISGGQIYNQAARSLGEFGKSLAGRQALNRYRMESEQSGSSMSAQGANQYLASILLKAGQGFAYSDSSSGLSAALNDKGTLDRKKKEDKTGVYAKIPFTTYMPNEVGINIDAKTGTYLGSGGGIEAFKEGSAANASKGVWAAVKGGANQWMDYMTNDKNHPRTDHEKQVIQMIGESYKELNKQRKTEGQPPIASINEYNKMIAGRANKQQQLSQFLPMEKKEQEMYEHNYVESGAIRGMIAIDPKNPTDRTKTVDDIIRAKFDLKADAPITAAIMKEHNINIIGVPSSNPLTPKGFGLDIDGQRIVVDASASMGNPGEYKPSTDKEAVDLNSYNVSRAEANIGKHEFISYRKQDGKFMKDNQGNYIGSKMIAVYDPETGKTFVRASK